MAPKKDKVTWSILSSLERFLVVPNSLVPCFYHIFQSTFFVSEIVFVQVPRAHHFLRQSRAPFTPCFKSIAPNMALKGIIPVAS